MNKALSRATRESILFIAGLLGLISYIVEPGFRDPLLLPIYGAMMGLPFVLGFDKTKQSDEEKKPE